MSRISFSVMLLIVVALYAYAGDTGLGTSPFSSGDQLTATVVNTFNDQINDNAADILTLQGYVPDTDEVTGNTGDGPGPVPVIDDMADVSADNTQLMYDKAIKDYVDSSGGGWSAAVLSAAPGSPVTGNVYVADAEAAGWDPCTSDATTDYLVMYNGAVYLPLWNVDGTPIVQTAAPGTPKTGWFYWADADGTWDPDTEVSGTDPYQVYYNGAGYISVRKQDGTLLTSTWHTKCATIVGTDADADYFIEQLPYDITIQEITVVQSGATNVIGGLDKCDSAGGSCGAVDSDITATSSRATDDGSLSSAGIDADDVIRWHTTSVSGTNTQCLVCFSYTIDN